MTKTSASTEASTAPGDDAGALIAWLRDYGEHRSRSRIWDERRTLPPHVVSDLGRAGVLGMLVPDRFGGRPLSSAGALRVVEQISAIDTTLAGLVGVTVALGVRPIVRHGTEYAQERFLPELARGTMLGGLALTEPGAGSDPRAIRARGVPCDQGARLHGPKWWVGNGAWAGVLNCFVRLDSARGGSELAGFCVSGDCRELVQGPEAPTMGMRAMVQNEVRLEGVLVSERDRLGAPGRGLDVLSDTLSYGRFGICAMALGAMKRSMQLLHRYASRRRVSTGLLLSHPDVRRYFARAAGAIEIAESLLAHAAARLDRGERVEELWSAAAKVVVPELAFEVVDGAMQRLGGRGYIETNELPRIHRDARLLRIFEGPTEALASHLGALALTDPAALAPRLGAADASWLEERIAQVRLLIRAPGPDKRDRMVAVAFDLGVWLAHALLSALCAASSAPGSHALTVLRPHLEHGRARVMAALAGEGALAPADAGAIARSVQASIGDLDPRGAVDQLEIDPLLRRSGG
ncbi:MAG: acyl-CoA dehydrogenase family protein [Sandaracinaceae bacterium]|nr:acyl-CoA dehydrogenase family protein [Sandaracinaceae bacterium]